MGSTTSVLNTLSTLVPWPSAGARSRTYSALRAIPAARSFPTCPTWREMRSSRPTVWEPQRKSHRNASATTSSSSSRVERPTRPPPSSCVVPTTVCVTSWSGPSTMPYASSRGSSSQRSWWSAAPLRQPSQSTWRTLPPPSHPENSWQLLNLRDLTLDVVSMIPSFLICSFLLLLI